MKVCSNCEFSKKDIVQTPMGGQYTYICEHSECVDPVEGQPLSCLAARQQTVFCSIDGKYFKKKEEKVVAQLIDIGV